MRENQFPTLRLLLRSVYLKGHQDGNIKTSDMSWEDKIVASIRSVLLKELPKEKEPEEVWEYEADSSVKRLDGYGKGYNQYASEAREVIERVTR